MSDPPDAQPRRVYDKGERRYKHVGRTDSAEVVFEDENPKRAIGKCPATIGQATRETLLRQAIPGPIGDRNLPVPKTLYAVHRGVIYEAQTSDAGMTYHAYPYHGPLAGRLVKLLYDRAVEAGYEPEFEAWARSHIEVRGRRR